MKPRSQYGDVPPDFFSKRWISRYIVESIIRYGDASSAYDLLMQDTRPQQKRRLRVRR